MENPVFEPKILLTQISVLFTLSYITGQTWNPEQEEQGGKLWEYEIKFQVGRVTWVEWPILSKTTPSSTDGRLGDCLQSDLYWSRRWEC